MISNGDLFLIVGTSWGGEPEQQAEFNDWYSNEHIAEMVTMPGVLRGDRYKKLGGDERSSPFMATYIFNNAQGWEDYKSHPIRKFLKYAGWQKFPNGFQASYHIIYKKMAYFDKSCMDEGGPEGVISIKGLNFKDEKREEEFNSWNHNYYIPLLLQSPDIIRINRFVTFGDWGDPNDPTPQFIIVSEFRDEQAYRRFGQCEVRQKADQELMSSWPIGQTGYEMMWDSSYTRIITRYRNQHNPVV